MPPSSDASARPKGSLDRILRESRRLFYERGYDATSMQDIANALSLHKSTLYSHIDSKEKLLDLACRDVLDNLELSLDRVEQHRDLPARERVLMAFGAAADLALEDVIGTNVILMQRGTTPVGRAVHHRRVAYESRFIELIREAQRSGGVRNDIDAALLARSILGMINWLVTWLRPNDQRFSAEEIRRSLVSIIDTGM